MLDSYTSPPIPLENRYGLCVYAVYISTKYLQYSSVRYCSITKLFVHFKLDQCAFFHTVYYEETTIFEIL